MTSRFRFALDRPAQFFEFRVANLEAITDLHPCRVKLELGRHCLQQGGPQRETRNRVTETNGINC
jgi:hypothetical protein